MSYLRISLCTDVGLNHKRFLLCLMFALDIENDSLLRPRPMCAGADQGFLKGGGAILGLQAKKGPTLSPMLKSLHRGPKRWGPDPLDPPPPRSAHDVLQMDII